MKQTILPTTVAAVALAATVVCSTAACASSQTDRDGTTSPAVGNGTKAADPADLTVGVDDEVALRSRLAADDLTAGGEKASTLALVTADGGRLRAARGLAGARAIRFPAYTPGQDGPDAIIKVLPAGEDWLSPHREPLSFGLDLKLDPVSSGSKRDNGDNVLQRGLFVDDAQYKIQVDHHYPSCVIRGSAGRVIARLSTRLRADRWYRVGCTRRDRTVKLRVATLDSHGQTVSARSTTAKGSIGSLAFTLLSPLSIGGKISDDGDPAAATDQFNGVIDRVRLNIG